MKQYQLTLIWSQIYITFKIVCDGMKQQTKTLRVEWNGKWRSRKSDLVSIFGYEWIDFINKK